MMLRVIINTSIPFFETKKIILTFSFTTYFFYICKYGCMLSAAPVVQMRGWFFSDALPESATISSSEFEIFWEWNFFGQLKIKREFGIHSRDKSKPFLLSIYHIMPRNFDHYPKNVGILGMEMYFPSRVSSSGTLLHLTEILLRWRWEHQLDKAHHPS